MNKEKCHTPEVESPLFRIFVVRFTSVAILLFSTVDSIYTPFSVKTLIFDGLNLSFCIQLENKRKKPTPSPTHLLMNL